MAKIEVPYTQYFAQTMQRMREGGLLLVAGGGSLKPNVMTIGWGAIGSIWGRPSFIVLVRPSRHTFSRLEELPDFTVNVPPPELAEAVAYCGRVSGREQDKFADMRLSPMPGRQVRSPLIAECVVHYECRTIHRNDVVPASLIQAIRDETYSKGDCHRIFFGEIAAVCADEDASQRLGP